MKISDKISVQKIVEQCQLNGISDIVISPGSRNAPFIISYTHNPFFKCYSIVDERSAGYFALGIAQQKNAPVALVCTSGTAALNYAPAVAEAHMQGIPLLIITADRQSNGLEIGDGQVINQDNLYQNFCVNNYTLVEDEADLNKLNLALIQEGFYELSKSKSVHFNVQLSEPLYDTREMEVDKSTSNTFDKLKQTKIGERVRKEELFEKWNSYTNKLILVSQNNFEKLDWLELLLKKDSNVVVLSETPSNFNDENTNSCIDRTIELIDKQNPGEFIPDLIVTIGHSVISKKIKRLFRAHKPREHWSFSEVRNDNLFECSQFSTFNFLDELSEIASTVSEHSISDFKNKWKFIEKKSKEGHKEFLENVPFSDLKVFDFLIKNLPSCNLQMGNSSVVRYIQLFNQRKDVNHNSNRGVSGIEGCTSTALGAHQVTENSILISGDISFFYDSNGFWNNYVSSNFKTIVINNGEGNIFKILPHPKKHEKALPFFTTPHTTSIEKFCDLYDLKYFVASELDSLEQSFNEFLNSNEKASVLEIDTSKVDNDKILMDYFSFIKEYN